MIKLIKYFFSIIFIFKLIWLNIDLLLEIYVNWCFGELYLWKLNLWTVWDIINWNKTLRMSIDWLFEGVLVFEILFFDDFLFGKTPNLGFPN